MSAKEYFRRIGQSDRSLGRKSAKFMAVYGGFRWTDQQIDWYLLGWRTT